MRLCSRDRTKTRLNLHKLTYNSVTYCYYYLSDKSGLRHQTKHDLRGLEIYLNPLFVYHAGFAGKYVPGKRGQSCFISAHLLKGCICVVKAREVFLGVVHVIEVEGRVDLRDDAP